MKTYLFSSILLCALVFNSCLHEASFGKITIPSEQKLVFSEPDNFYDIKSIIILINKTDTMFVSNQRFVDRICYLRLAFPNEDIIIEYVKSDKDGKKIFAPRFINLQKE